MNEKSTTKEIMETTASYGTFVPRSYPQLAPVWQTLGSEHSAFSRDEKVLVLAERNLHSLTNGIFSRSKRPDVPKDELVALLHFVEITIIERKIVRGDYRAGEQHYGFRGLGSDGWYYVCQWSKFDDCSTNPYSNWQREFVEGVHYTSGKDGTNNWRIPEDELVGHYMNWPVTDTLRKFDEPNAIRLMEHIKETWPHQEMEVCEVPDTSYDKVPYTHKKYGPYLKSRGCWMCQFNAEKTKHLEKEPS